MARSGLVVLAGDFPSAPSVRSGRDSRTAQGIRNAWFRILYGSHPGFLPGQPATAGWEFAGFQGTQLRAPYLDPAFPQPGVVHPSDAHGYRGIYPEILQGETEIPWPWDTEGPS